MADKLSARTEITSGLTANDLMHLVNAGASWKMKLSTLATWLGTGGGLTSLSTGAISATGVITGTAVAGAINLSGATTSNRRIDIGNTGQTTNIGVDSSTGGAAIAGGAAYSTFINSGAAASPVQVGVNSVLICSFTSTAIAASVPVRLKNYTVATLPAGTQGDTAFVTDALAPTFLTALAGGGAVVTPAFYNGTAWVAY